VKLYYRLSALAVGFLLLGGGPGLMGKEKDRTVSFGELEATKADAAKALALSWLKQAGKTDPATMQKFEALWGREDRTVLDRVADSLTLGSAEAAHLLSEARNPQAPPPIKVPHIFKDAKQPILFRANLGLVYARALSNRQVHEEALETLKLFHPEQVVAPTSYLFHRAVCEHALLLRTEAGRTIGRLLEDAIGSPDRYKTVSALMLLDMQTWKEKDLGAVARKMKISERRWDLARGGPQTQKLHKEIEARLKELIKELENKAKGGS
jgi:hypothetical protein